MTIDIDHLRTWIGRTETTEDIVTPRLVREYRATLDPHLAPVAPDEAPLALHWCLSPAIAPAAELGPDGHPARGGFLPPVPLPRRMWAGGLIETGDASLRVGDRVTRISTIGNVDLKQGRSGALCFVAVGHEYRTERGPALSERHDIVYRDPPPAQSGPAPAKAAPPPDEGRRAELTFEVDATATLLFRYSAMTFNGHRIHYDLPYVTEVEGYPGLVVHGPLQATLMFNLAAVLGTGTPRRFEYRGLSPLIAGQRFRVLGRTTEAGVSTWTQSAEGAICMEGTASF